MLYVNHGLLTELTPNSSIRQETRTLVVDIIKFIIESPPEGAREFEVTWMGGDRRKMFVERKS